MDLSVIPVAEEDEIMWSPRQTALSPPQPSSPSSSDSDSNDHPGYESSAYQDSLPEPFVPAAEEKEEPLHRKKHSSEEELFIGMRTTVVECSWNSSEWQLAESILSDPQWWSTAYQQLSSVVPGGKLHPAVLDFYLMQEWYTVALQTVQDSWPALYLGRSVVQLLTSGTPRHTLRRLLLLPDHGIIKRRPVLLLQGLDSGRIVLVLLDFISNQVFLFGVVVRDSQDNPYISWNNRRLWNAVADGFGWATEDAEPSAFQLNWVQVYKPW